MKTETFEYVKIADLDFTKLENKFYTCKCEFTYKSEIKIKEKRRIYSTRFDMFIVHSNEKITEVLLSVPNKEIKPEEEIEDLARKALDSEMPDDEDESGDFYRGDTVFKMLTKALSSFPLYIKGDKKQLLRLFQDFFTFHNESNKGFTGIDKLFNDWFDAKLPVLSNNEYSKEQMKNCFDESRLTHPMIGFKHNTFDEYIFNIKADSKNCSNSCDWPDCTLDGCMVKTKIPLSAQFMVAVRERMQWSLETFTEATALSSLEKLRGEVDELEADIIAGTRSPLEYADILHCLVDIGGREKEPVSIEEILTAFIEKFEINKKRIWIKNPDNTYSHKKY